MRPLLLLALLCWLAHLAVLLGYICECPRPHRWHILLVAWAGSITLLGLLVGVALLL